MMFLLTEVFEVGRYGNLPGFADIPPDLMLAILREAARVCEEVVQPIFRRSYRRFAILEHEYLLSLAQQDGPCVHSHSP
jgi:hypothetical protein